MILNTQNDFTDIMKVYKFTGIVSINNGNNASVKYSIQRPRHFLKFKYKKFYKRYMDFINYVEKNSSLGILKEYEIY